MSKKKRTASQSRWLQEHFKDVYVREAHKQGLRSRASFKIEEIQERDRLFKPGYKVVDLGAAPGGWSQYATTCVGENGRVVACDILPMDPIYGVDFLQGDFREQSVLDELLRIVGDTEVDVVMSDMAPNMSGNLAVDQPRAMYLVELAFEMCNQILKKGGSFVVKVFNGEGTEAYLRMLRSAFKEVKVRKPDASRSRSREVYYVGLGFKGAREQEFFR